MGTTNSTTNLPKENVYKLCLKCAVNKHFNENIKVLNICKYRTHSGVYKAHIEHEFILMCDKCHMFKYICPSIEHYNYVNKYFKNKEVTKNISENELKKEIEKLKQEIDNLKARIPENKPVDDIIETTFN